MRSSVFSQLLTLSCIVMCCSHSLVMRAQGTLIVKYRNCKFGTDQSVRSAINELPYLKNDSNKVNLLNELGQYFISYALADNAESEKAFHFLSQGICLSDSIYDPHSFQRYVSRALLARAYIMTRRLEEGKKQFQDLVNEVHPLNKKWEADVLRLYAFTLEEVGIHSLHDDSSAAISCAIELYQNTGDVRMEIEARVAGFSACLLN